MREQRTTEQRTTQRTKRLLASVALSISGAILVGCRQPEAAAADPGSAAAERRLGPFTLPASGGGAVSWPGTDAAAATFLHVFQPDCPACREHAKALAQFAAQSPAPITVLGVAHRGSAADVAAFRAATGVRYPLAVGSGSNWAERWGVGDPMYVVDREGRIAYAQVGFHPTDVDAWTAVAADLAAGRPPRLAAPDRAAVAIAVGQRLPTIALSDLDGEPLRLYSDGGLLRFARGDAAPEPQRAAIGFFSRY